MGCRQVYAVLCPGVVTLSREQKWLHRLQKMIDTKLQLVDRKKEQPLPTQVFSFVATETGSKALRTGAGYTCRICPSLRWNERVFSSSLSRSLVAAPDIFIQSRIHWPAEMVNQKQEQSLLHFGKKENSGKILHQRWQAARFSFGEGRDRWLLTSWPTKRKSGSYCLLQTFIRITVAPRRLYTVCWHVVTWSRKKVTAI